MEDKDKKYPEGHFVGMWIGICMASFTGLGIPLSIALGNFGFMGIGPAIGVAFGVAIGSGIEAKKKEEGKIRPLNKKEKKRKRIAVFAGIGTLLLGFAAFVLIYFSRG